MRIVALAVPLLGLLIGCAVPAQERPLRTTEAWTDDRPAPRGASLLRRAMLDVQNAARAEVGAPPLVWNDRLAEDAARYAGVLAETRTFRHSAEPRGATPEGENLFMGTRDAYRYDEMAQQWVNERRVYRAGAVPDISTTGHWQDVGHYTQIVWRRTTEMGCAVASSRSDDYLVCRYSPPGNVWGRRAGD